MRVRRPVRSGLIGFLILILSVPVGLFLYSYAWSWHEQQIAEDLLARVRSLTFSKDLSEEDFDAVLAPARPKADFKLSRAAAEGCADEDYSVNDTAPGLDRVLTLGAIGDSPSVRTRLNARARAILLPVRDIRPVC